VAGALPGRSYLEKLRSVGFRSAEIVGRTGYATSVYTEAAYIVALR